MSPRAKAFGDISLGFYGIEDQAGPLRIDHNNFKKTASLI